MKRVLIAEDDTFLANAYRVKLSRAGYDVQIVSDGAEALAAINTKVPDILILDLMMPKKDGFSVLNDLKTNPLFTGIPVIVASNLGQSEDLQKAMNLGANDYIIKTDLSLNDLIAKIKKMIGE